MTVDGQKVLDAYTDYDRPDDDTSTSMQAVLRLQAGQAVCIKGKGSHTGFWDFSDYTSSFSAVLVTPDW